ncbi:MAG: cobalamin-binding protein [Hyphomicrobiales bacterium]
MAEIPVAGPPVVSLLPAATEIICALGAADRLVAVSHECDYPDIVRGLPRVTRTRMALDGPGPEIHDRVRDLVERGLAIYEVDADALKCLSPEVIVTQTQCEVCAASPDDLKRALGDWLGVPPQVVSLEALTLDGIWADMRAVGAALGLTDAADALVGRLNGRISALRDRAMASGRRPRVGVLEWMAPPMAGGNWMPELLQRAGCEPAWGRAGEHSPWLTPEDIRNADPEILVVIPCGYTIDRTLAESGALTNLEIWPDLRAVRDGRVYIADGNAYFNRPGPRVVESIEILLDMVHGAGKADSPAGEGWIRLK